MQLKLPFVKVDVLNLQKRRNYRITKKIKLEDVQ
ncbi:hypothetical protein SAMN04489864_103164 [Pedobacter insulae]|uniref:Uncharacterized protein n=1 Tax=Pedobacter insulae TaxID=414048 RepID=A0A1I2VPE3_9SPHI|nr:hypothetical protein SAMN04489864_103164 [Pedobacter insulae]